MLWGISEMVNGRAYKSSPMCWAPLDTYFWGFLELYEQNKATLKAKMCFEKMLLGISEMVNVRAFKP